MKPDAGWLLAVTVTCIHIKSGASIASWIRMGITRHVPAVDAVERPAAPPQQMLVPPASVPRAVVLLPWCWQACLLCQQQPCKQSGNSRCHAALADAQRLVQRLQWLFLNRTSALRAVSIRPATCVLDPVWGQIEACSPAGCYRCLVGSGLPCHCLGCCLLLTTHIP